MGEKQQPEIPAGLKLHSVLRGHEDAIHQIAWSPDGKLLASPSRDQTARIWSLETGKIYQSLKEGHSQAVACAWSPDGKTLAISSSVDSVHLWNVEVGELTRTHQGEFGLITAMGYSPRGKEVATVSANGTVRLWDAQIGASQLLRKRHADTLYSMTWDSQGMFFACGSSDHKIRIWGLEDHKLYNTLEEQEGEIFSLAWSSPGIASGSNDGTICIWNPLDGGELKETLEGHTAGVIGLSYSSDGQLLASKSLDGTVRIWSCDIWETLAVFPEPSSGFWLPGVAFHPKKPILATLGEKDTAIRIWELDLDVLLGNPGG